MAIIQARMQSTRLPGKSLLDICGKPLLAHVIERVSSCKTLDETVVATTNADEDKPIRLLATKHGLRWYAGSEDDVLDRFYRTAVKFSGGIVVRITADDPFKDPQVVDKVVRHHIEHSGLEYTSNTIVPTYPEGLDVEVVAFKALERAWREATTVSDREHVTPYIWNNPQTFTIANVRNDIDLSHLRWTVDYERDLRFARAVYARLYHGQVFLMEDILKLLQAEPELARINQGISRNEGYLRSRDMDSSPRQGDRAGRNGKRLEPKTNEERP